jgi:hypothetical protein
VEKMAIAAVAHIYVYPATPYQQHLDRKEQNVNSFDSMTVDEIEEDLEIAATSVKDSIQDVVFGGGGHVRFLSLLIIFHEVISTENLGFRVLV